MTGGYLRRLVDRAAGTTQASALQPRIPALFEPITAGFQPVSLWSGALSTDDVAVDWGPDRPERTTAGAAAPDQSSGELRYPSASAAPSQETPGSTRAVWQAPPVDAVPQLFASRALAAPALGLDRAAPVPADSALPPAPAHAPTSNLGGPRAADARSATPHRPTATDGSPTPAPIDASPAVPSTGPAGTAGRPAAPARIPAEPPTIVAAQAREAVPSGRTSEAALTHPAWPASAPGPATDARAPRREEPTVVRVSIGRIEVHAAAPDHSAAPPPAPEPPISLERYLQERVPR